VHVDPIRPRLKAPGSPHLKLKCGDLLSNFAFKFNLRRYSKEVAVAERARKAEAGRAMHADMADLKAGAYTRSLFSST